MENGHSREACCLVTHALQTANARRRAGDTIVSQQQCQNAFQYPMVRSFSTQERNYGSCRHPMTPEPAWTKVDDMTGTRKQRKKDGPNRYFPRCDCDATCRSQGGMRYGSTNAKRMRAGPGSKHQTQASSTTWDTDPGAINDEDAL